MEGKRERWMETEAAEKQKRKKTDQQAKQEKKTQKQNVTSSTIMSMNVYINRSVQSL